MGKLKPHQVIISALILMAGVSVIDALAPQYSMPLVIVILLSLLLVGNSRLLTRGGDAGNPTNFVAALQQLINAGIRS